MEYTHIHSTCKNNKKNEMKRQDEWQKRKENDKWSKKNLTTMNDLQEAIITPIKKAENLQRIVFGEPLCVHTGNQQKNTIQNHLILEEYLAIYLVHCTVYVVVENNYRKT